MIDDVRNVYFIKLGIGGNWAQESIDKGIIRFGYHAANAELANAGLWDAFKDEMRGAWTTDEGAHTRHVSQVKKFYEADERDIFITFHARSLFWCRPTGPIERYSKGKDEGAHWRRTVAGWSNRSVGGQPLFEDRLSGNLTKVQMFRGTISDVSARNYLVRKLNDENLPQVDAALSTYQDLVEKNVELMKLLTWRDFELLVDLVFSASGWRRISEVGRTTKTVDIELVLPTTGERAFLQVKSRTNTAQLQEYVRLFQETEAYDRMFFVWHSGAVDTSIEEDGVTLLDPHGLAQMVIEAGLTSWLIEKVS